MIKLLLIKEDGSAGILSIITMLLLGVIGAFFIGITRTEVGSSASYRDGVAAQYLAEAGAKRAIIELDLNNGWIGVSNVSMGNGVTAGKYNVTVTAGSGNNRTITSVGIVNNASRTVIVKLTVASSNTQAYRYTLFAGGNMVINNNAIVSGSVRSNTYVEMKNNTQVTQDVMAPTVVLGNSGVIVNGTVTRNTPVLAPPTYNVPSYKATSTAIDNLSNNQVLTPSLNGTYYHEGTWTLGNNSKVSGTATIYVNGDVVISNGAALTGNFWIVSSGSIYLQPGAIVNKGVLYAANNIDFSNVGTFVGTAVAGGTVTNSNVGSVNYNYDIGVIDVFGLGGAKIISWSNF